MKTSAHLTISRIIYLVDVFNFDCVRKAMIALDLKWAQPDGLRTPTIDEMRDHCVNLLINADRENTTVGSGGFEAICKVDDNGKKTFRLNFIVAWDSILV